MEQATSATAYHHQLPATSYHPSHSFSASSNNNASDYYDSNQTSSMFPTPFEQSSTIAVDTNTTTNQALPFFFANGGVHPTEPTQSIIPFYSLMQPSNSPFLCSSAEADGNARNDRQSASVLRLSNSLKSELFPTDSSRPESNNLTVNGITDSPLKTVKSSPLSTQMMTYNNTLPSCSSSSALGNECSALPTTIMYAGPASSTNDGLNQTTSIYTNGIISNNKASESVDAYQQQQQQIICSAMGFDADITNACSSVNFNNFFNAVDAPQFTTPLLLQTDNGDTNQSDTRAYNNSAADAMNLNGMETKMMNGGGALGINNNIFIDIGQQHKRQQQLFDGQTIIESMQCYQESGGNFNSNNMGANSNTANITGEAMKTTMLPLKKVSNGKKRVNGELNVVGERKRPHSCQLCKSTFVSKTELHEHQNSHTGEKPFECAVCHARFNRRSTLWNHNRIHKTDKPFECKICNMTFKWKNSLKCHTQMHNRKQEFAPLPKTTSADDHNTNASSGSSTIVNNNGPYSIEARKQNNTPLNGSNGNHYYNQPNSTTPNLPTTTKTIDNGIQHHLPNHPLYTNCAYEPFEFSHKPTPPIAIPTVAKQKQQQQQSSSTSKKRQQPQSRKNNHSNRAKQTNEKQPKIEQKMSPFELTQATHLHQSQRAAGADSFLPMQTATTARSCSNIAIADTVANAICCQTNGLLDDRLGLANAAAVDDVLMGAGCSSIPAATLFGVFPSENLFSNSSEQHPATFPSFWCANGVGCDLSGNFPAVTCDFPGNSYTMAHDQSSITARTLFNFSTLFDQPQQQQQQPNFQSFQQYSQAAKNSQLLPLAVDSHEDAYCESGREFIGSSTNEQQGHAHLDPSTSHLFNRSYTQQQRQQHEHDQQFNGQQYNQHQQPQRTMPVSVMPFFNVKPVVAEEEWNSLQHQQQNQQLHLFHFEHTPSLAASSTSASSNSSLIGPSPDTTHSSLLPSSLAPKIGQIFSLSASTQQGTAVSTAVKPDPIVATTAENSVAYYQQQLQQASATNQAQFSPQPCAFYEQQYPLTTAQLMTKNEYQNTNTLTSPSKDDLTMMLATKAHDAFDITLKNVDGVEHYLHQSMSSMMDPTMRLLAAATTTTTQTHRQICSSTVPVPGNDSAHL